MNHLMLHSALSFSRIEFPCGVRDTGIIAPEPMLNNTEASTNQDHDMPLLDFSVLIGGIHLFLLERI